MSAFIPQLDPHPGLRSLKLQQTRLLYQYNHSYVSPLAVLDRLPIQDDFSFNWMKLVGQRIMTLFENQLDLEGDSVYCDFLRAKHGLLNHILDSRSYVLLGVMLRPQECG